MRIVHILDHALPAHSGYVFRTMGIVGAQEARGLEPVLMTTPRQPGNRPDGPGRETVEGRTIYRTPAPAGRFPLPGLVAEMAATRRRLREVVAEVRPDILHAHSPALNAWPALLSGLGLPVVYEIRAFWEDAAVDHGTAREDGPRYRLGRALETAAARRADAVTTICEGLRGELLGRGLAPERVTVVPNAVDPERFTPCDRKDPALLRELDLEGCFVLGFLGSFYAYEGLDLAIAAMPALLAANPATRLLLAGGGPEEARLQAQAKALGVRHAVHFAGRIPHERIGDWYGLADLLVYPRKSMRLTELVTPLKPLEAMARKRPVLASDVGGHRELIADGRTGFLFPAGSAAGLVEAVERIRGLPADRLQALNDEARRFVERERSWSASVARHVEIYERLLSERSTHHIL